MEKPDLVEDKRWKGEVTVPILMQELAYLRHIKREVQVVPSLDTELARCELLPGRRILSALHFVNVVSPDREVGVPLSQVSEKIIHDPAGCSRENTLAPPRIAGRGGEEELRHVTQDAGVQRFKRSSSLGLGEKFDVEQLGLESLRERLL